MDRLPSRTRKFVERIEKEAGVSYSDLVSIAFIVSLIDALHASVYATFLSVSFAEELRKKLGVDIEVKFEVQGTHWSWQQGTISTQHRISCDFDGYAMHLFPRIGGMVLSDEITPEQGLQLIDDYHGGKAFSKWELGYRTFPGRALTVPLMACGCTTIFFGGSLTDAAFSVLAGLVAGFAHWVSTEDSLPRLARFHDFLVSTGISIYCLMAVAVHPESTCFKAQLLGTMFWFFYGVAFTTALFEMTSGQLRTGALRCLAAGLHSFGLAIGVVLGVVIVILQVGMEREHIIRDCSADHTVSTLSLALLFPILGSAVLMQLRVAPRDWAVCMVVMMTTFGSQYVCSTRLEQGVLISNLVPSFLATVTTYLLLRICGRACTCNIKDFVADSGESRGQSRVSIAEYEYRDVWFCLLPALYLLVPGSGLIKASLFSIAGVLGFLQKESIPDNLALDVLFSGVGQVLGVRLGLATVRAFTEQRRRQILRFAFSPTSRDRT